MQNEAFDAFYAKIWQSRWPSLFQALSSPAKHHSRLNAFAASNLILKDSYEMDLASCLCAQALDVQPGMEVLDVCSAPGGKALILAESLWLTEQKASIGRLHLNELSTDRFHRLKRVIDQYLPEPLKPMISYSKLPGETLFRKYTQRFDRVLLDVPCSSERHVLASASDLKDWSPSRPKSLAKKQFSLLCSGAECLRSSGVLVYSTCSINPGENDGVVARFLERATKKGLPYSLVQSASLSGKPPEIGEATSHGWLILPDTTGWGPIYFSMIQRN